MLGHINQYAGHVVWTKSSAFPSVGIDILRITSKQEESKSVTPGNLPVLCDFKILEKGKMDCQSVQILGLRNWRILDCTDLQQDHIILFQLLPYGQDGLCEGQHLCWKLVNLILHSCHLLFFFFFHSCYSFRLFVIKDLMELLELGLDKPLCFQRLILMEIITNSGLNLTFVFLNWKPKIYHLIIVYLDILKCICRGSVNLFEAFQFILQALER